jgi:Bifunctional DNA primase/polymerase, N-terminal
MIPAVQRALECATYLRTLGLTPLPSHTHDKLPAGGKYTHYYDGAAVPESVYDEWSKPNIQVITGVSHLGPTKIVVVDLDGDEAPDIWKKLCFHNRYEPSSTWMTRTGSGGTHLWYRLPPGVTECKSGIIWGVYDTWGEEGNGGWMKHKEIRILGDRALVVCPPSVHVKTGERYRFMPGCSPREHRLPEVAPAWLLAMPRLVSPRFQDAKPRHVIRPPERLSGRHYMRQEVLDAIPDKVALLKAWGLKFDRETPNASGWASCFVPWRETPENSRPSGTMHCLDGTFQDRKDNTSMSFFDVAAILQPGMFPKWTACKNWCGDRYIGRISRA